MVVDFIVAFLTWKIGRPYRNFVLEQRKVLPLKALKIIGRKNKNCQEIKNKLILALLPPILLNGFIIGSYLPFLLTDNLICGLYLAQFYLFFLKLLLFWG